MSSVNYAFEQFISGLELRSGEAERAIRQKEVVRDKVRGKLDIKRDIISGSYSRNTAIRPLHDIDLFFILDERTHGHLQDNPRMCLRAVLDALDAAYPNKDRPTLQTRSVGISFAGTGIGYDIVPAFEAGPVGVYEIPDRDANHWVRTNPEVHKAVSTAANEVAGKKLKPLIKAAKHWNANAASEKPLRSFHLEVMAYSAFPSPPDSYALGLYLLFDRLASAVMQTCPDPSGLGPNIDQGVGGAERQTAQELLRAAARSAQQALWLDREGHTDQAHFLWRELLGPEYPERGQRPSEELLRALTMGLGTGAGLKGTDHQSNRFG